MKYIVNTGVNGRYITGKIDGVGYVTGNGKPLVFYDLREAKAAEKSLNMFFTSFIEREV